MDQVTKVETKTLLEIAQSTLDSDTKGDWVELGCYKGATSALLAKLLQTSDSSKSLFLYDSFAGLPEKTNADSSSAGTSFKRGELLASKREVVEHLKHTNLDLRRIKIHKAFFENLDKNKDLPKNISFAFLDGDFYQSIKTSLKLVFDKISPGGIIIVHDYHNPELPGPSRAVDEFLHVNPQFKLTVRYSLAILSHEKSSQ